MIVLESMTAKDLSHEQQVFIACSMLEILRASYPGVDNYNSLEAFLKAEAQKELHDAFGARGKDEVP